jgi:pantoate--beta-alanine ligase
LTATVFAHTASHIREIVSGWRAARRSVALVPTMGNLHSGHMSLVDLAAEYADAIVMSIFVNPTQFGIGEDFSAYPRTLAEDQALIERSGKIDALFVPDVPEIYPFGIEEAARISIPRLADELCGASRPGHFAGVLSVVARLINIVSPDVLVLGRKDYQQLVLVERMIADLRFAVQLVAGDTQRDADGLAISSRNHYLTAGERASAPALHAALERVGAALRGGARDYAGLQAHALEDLRAAGFSPDYVEVRLARDLARPNGSHTPQDLVVLGAAWLGRARLIDNVLVGR